MLLSLIGVRLNTVHILMEATFTTIAHSPCGKRLNCVSINLMGLTQLLKTVCGGLVLNEFYLLLCLIELKTISFPSVEFITYISLTPISNGSIHLFNWRVDGGGECQS